MTDNTLLGMAELYKGLQEENKLLKEKIEQLESRLSNCQ